MLRTSPETKATFISYFEAGMTPSQAINHHESLLAVQPDGPQLLASGFVNPTKRAVYYMHDHWRTDKYGPCGSPLVKLQEKMPQYAAQGTDVYTSSKADDCWAALVVTPIMRRAQSLESAQELIFVDSTASCDTTRSTVTVLLTATKAGAVPIAVLIHSSQSREGYSLAFQLLKHCYPTCFGNREAPAAFMSDSSRPEKDALRDVWPSAQQLLCHFHILQAEWRWITSSHHKVDKDDRRRFMAAFQKVLPTYCSLSTTQKIDQMLCEKI
ncbi:uncharacterized protein LOC144121629 [Amblyomma americanum]